MRPYFSLFTLPRGLVLALSLLAVLNLSKIGLGKPLTVDRPADFRAVWTGVHALRHQRDPYPDATLRTEWQAVVQAEALPSSTAPGRWGESFLYPPWAAALLAGTVAALPWRVAYPLWWALCLAGLLLSTLRWWPRILRAWGAPAATGPDLLLLALALKGTVAALLVGQPTFVAFALGTAALRARQLGRPLRAGLLLGLAAFKITLVGPFALLALVPGLAAGRWRAAAGTAGAAGAVVALLTLAAVRLHPAGAALLGQYAGLAGQVRTAIFTHPDAGSAVNYQLVSLTEFGPLLNFVRPGTWRYLSVFYAALALAGVGWAWRYRRHLTPLVGWLVAVLLTLLTTYHLFYDALLLLPLVAWAQRLPRPAAWATLAAAAPLLLPLNAALAALHATGWAEIGYFTLPVSCALLLGLLMTVSTFRRAQPAL